MAKADQADILAQNAKLTTDLETSQTELGAANQRISALTTENTSLQAAEANYQTQIGAIRADLTSITSERDSLKVELDRMKAEKATFDAAVASKVATLGIVEPKKTQTKSTDKKLTFTERVLAAKNAKSLEELAERRELAMNS